jgi:hypothetical protein
MVSRVGAQGRPEFATNDPQAQETVADAVKEMLGFTAVYDTDPGRSVAIASAFFNVGGWSLIAPELKRVGHVRLMLGAEPQRQTDPVVMRSPSIPRRSADKEALAEALEAQQEALETERDVLPFTREARGQVQDLIDWLRSGKVEVKRYTKEFLHGKAYVIDNPGLGVVAGSSNFTFAGLSKNRELNLGQYSETTIDAVTTWFNDLWAEAEPFDLAAFFEEQVTPDEPWIVFLRMLWEAYGQQVLTDKDEIAADPSMRDLLAFQRDGVGRARRILEKHNGVLIADEVGLGKTYVGGALVKDSVRARQRVLIVAPKIIRDTVWKPYVDREHLAGWVDVISYDDLLADETADGKRWRLPVARQADEYALIVLDEAHTVRNSDTRRAKELLNILSARPTEGAARKRVALLTATPVNNALGDLHSLLSYFVVHDDEFAEIGIPSLSARFRELDKMDTDELAPELLFDILDAVAVRRTRQFVRQNYVGQKISTTGETLVFPEPVVRRVDYDLAPVLHDFFDTFAHALGADREPNEPDVFYAGTIPAEGLSSLDDTRLTLAGYTPSRYQISDLDGDRRQQAAEVQVAGLLRTGLLKRFESSSAAFVATCRKMAATLDHLLSLIQNEGVVASGDSLRDWIKVDLSDEEQVQDWRAVADYAEADLFDTQALTADILSDMRLLRRFADTVEEGMRGTVDPKFEAITKTLVQVVDEAKTAATLRSAGQLTPDPDETTKFERDARKVLMFSFYADTVYYIQDHIDEILADPRLACYRGRVAFVTGTPNRTGGHGRREGTVPQDEAVAGFAPTTGGQVDANGQPISEDKYDLLITTDVLSQGVNLQQARNVASIDLPWNPQVLVQRHGRCDRIGSPHDRIYLWCFFPDIGLDQWLGLEAILHRKLAKAAASIGHGHVLPGVAASDDRVFNARNEQIESIAREGAELFTGHDRSLISGEEFRAILRNAIDNASLVKHLEAMPTGVGSGFTASDRPPGFVFCARILNRENEPVFRYMPLPAHLIPGATNPAPPLSNDQDPEDERPHVRGTPVDINTDTLSALSMANPPEDQRTTPHLPPEWQDLAYDAWEAAAQHIADTWNRGLDTAGQSEIPAAIRRAIDHILTHSTHINRDDADKAIKAYRRGQAARVTAIVRSVMQDEYLTDQTRTSRLIELVDELGLTAPENKPKRYAIEPSDLHLVAWMAIIPNTTTPTGAGETP